MKRRILIISGIVVLLLVGALTYLNNRNRTLSPPGETTATNGSMEVSVTYSRPSVRDRLIFGYEEEGALQPYGMYWRLGANEPTFLEVSRDFTFGESEMTAGKYVLYAIPRNGEMELRLNTDLRFWGYTEPDYEADVATTVVRIEPGPDTELFTISAESMSNGVSLVFNWGTYQWQLPLAKN